MSGAAARTGIFKEKRKARMDVENNGDLHGKECNFNDGESRINQNSVVASRGMDVYEVPYKTWNTYFESKKQKCLHKKRGGVNERYIGQERRKQRVTMSGAAARTGGLRKNRRKKGQ